MSTIRILVIDDNPMIRDLIRRGLESFGEVQLASDSGEALNQLEAAAPDLVVIDAELGSNDNTSLVQEIQQRLKTPMILLLPRDADEEWHRSFAGSTDQIVEKPFFIQDLQARVRHIVERIQIERMARNGDGDSLRGTLAQMSVTDLVQSLEMGRKSCCLVLTGVPSGVSKTTKHSSSGTQQCEMYFVEGQLVHAASGWLLGDEAVYDALRWQGDGIFRIDFQATTDLHTTTRSTQALLMEGMRLLDEANRSASAGECGDGDDGCKEDE